MREREKFDKYWYMYNVHKKIPVEREMGKDEKR